MSDSQPIPTSLKVVAVLFIVGGITSVIEIIVSLLNGHLNLNFGVFGLAIGVGLRRLNPTWRTWALVSTWFALLVSPLFGLIILFDPGPLDFTLFGQKVGQVPKAAGLIAALVFFLIALWQYRVLTRPDIRALFRLPYAGQG